MNFDKIPGIWFVLSGLLYVIGLVACAVLAPTGFGLGFAAGGALVLGNAWASARRIKKTGFLHRSGVTALLLGGFYVRLILLGICLYGIIRFLKVDPVGLVTGLSVVPAGLLIMLVLIYIANRRPEEV
jgi:ATP synthase I chain